MRSEAGIKIKNIKAGTLYGYNLGVRTRYDYTNAVLSNSLFSHYMEQHGMEIWKGESTRDIICLDFDFGSRSYEEELEHIRKLLAKATDENEVSHLNNLLLKVDNNKWNYNKLSKDEIRELFYRDGVDVTYFRRDKNGEVIDKEVIHYVMLERNSSKAKLGQVIFIRAELYETAIEWLTMGIHSKLPEHNVKIVELSAYAPLTTSTIVDRWHFPVENMLILPDQDSTFRAMANIVKPQDYIGTERIVDVEATEAAKQRAIAKNKLDINGNPIYKVCYKKIEINKKKCVVEHEETDITNTLWDGMGLIETSCLPAYVNGMALLRNHFFKMCGFRTRLQDFFRDWCEKTGNDYETYEIVDMFGFSHRIKDIKIVTTDNAVKWKKFNEFMGGTLPAAYQYWCDRINADGSYFGIVKTDHLSKLGHVQQMSYQMVNSLPCSRADVKEIAQTSITYVETLKTNPDEFEKFLRKNANEINHYEMLADLYDHNHLFAESKWFRQEKKKIINNYVNRLRSGKITVEGDNLTICGNPYALLLHSVGEDWTQDPTFNVEEGAIQCYTKRFEDDSYLAGFRSPHNAPNNIVYLHNHMHPLMDQYFEFSQNIVAVNCIHTDIQARCNGCDFDSDFLFVTNQPIIVECAQICQTEFPTIVNAIPESGISYDNRPEEYARMDNKFAKSKRGIGESSNLAQLALTYYWTNPQQDLYDNFVILSVLAQLIIDGCKREYLVDAISEIERIKKMPCMTMTKDGNRRDFPEFMKWTKAVSVTKNGKELPFAEISESRNKIINRINPTLSCPMNHLQDWLDKVQGAPKTNTIPTENFFIKMPGVANNRQMSRIRRMVSDFDSFLVCNLTRLSDDDFIEELISRTAELTKSVQGMNIRNKVTINRLIETALNIDKNNNGPHNIKGNGSQNVRRILNTLYRADKETFLANFVSDDRVATTPNEKSAEQTA